MKSEKYPHLNDLERGDPVSLSADAEALDQAREKPCFPVPGQLTEHTAGKTLQWQGFYGNDEETARVLVQGWLQSIPVPSAAVVPLGGVQKD